jgi:hypothetical protein
VCAIVKIMTVAIITLINIYDGHNSFFVPIIRATGITTVVVTNAWIVMLQILTKLPTKN